jgi:hypothetical protein
MNGAQVGIEPGTIREYSTGYWFVFYTTRQHGLGIDCMQHHQISDFITTFSCFMQIILQLLVFRYKHFAD